MGGLTGRPKNIWANLKMKPVTQPIKKGLGLGWALNELGTF